MAKFKVLLNGKNFLLNFEGRERKIGFYATRVVEAATAEEAESAAVDLLRRDKWLGESTLNGGDDPPMLYVEEITEVVRPSSGGDANTGFTFYAEPEE